MILNGIMKYEAMIVWVIWDYYNMNQLLQYGKWDYYTNKLYYMGSLHGILVCWLMISLGDLLPFVHW